MRTLVIIPTYNERENLEAVARAVLAQDDSLEILVVDDNSPDGSGGIAESLSWETGRLEVLHRPRKEGLGPAYVAGFRHALSHEYDRIVEMDADLSHRPEDVPRLLAAAEGADVVVGSRDVPGGRIEGWSALRQLDSRAGSLYARLMLGLPLHDCTSSFKCFRRDALVAIDLDQVRSNGCAFQVEMNYRCYRAGLRIAEVPILFRGRTAGDSKMSASTVLEAAILVGQLRHPDTPVKVVRVRRQRALGPHPYRPPNAVPTLVGRIGGPGDRES